MMPEVSQENFRALLPGKIARIILLACESTGRPPEDEFRQFYSSDTYRELERESSKYWWMSPEQLAEIYLAEGHSPSRVKR